MASKTYHVFPRDGAWAGKKEGAIAETHRTWGEAIKAAGKTAKKSTGGQVVIHAGGRKNREQETYGMTPVRDPPRRAAWPSGSAGSTTR